LGGLLNKQAGAMAHNMTQRINSTNRLTEGRVSYIFNSMVKYNVASDNPSNVASKVSPLDGVFHALGDATRRRMLADLAASARTVTELAAPFDMSLAAASKHIKVLESAGLLRREIQGRTHTCYLVARPLMEANEWLTHYQRFWSGRLDKLEELLRDDPPSGSSPALKKGKHT
jgi:DNA-binding transcriptional ArsR family regulator